MDAAFDWLTGLPLWALYLALAVVAGVENVFPPIPADTLVALGSFLAAQGKGSPVAAFLAVWLGNMAGAMAMYALGRKYGAERLERRLLGGKAAGAEARLQALHQRYGLAAISLSRFIPGVRAIVPPFAGAARVPALRAFLAMGAASAAWYGFVSWLGFRLGSDWERLVALVTRSGAILAIGAAVIVGGGVAVWWRRRRGRAG